MRITSAFLLGFLFSTQVFGGVYAKSIDPAYTAPIVVHPNTYNGTGGQIEIGVCLTGSAETHIRADVEHAIKVWNELTPYSMNCSGPCTPPQTNQTEPFFAIVYSVVLHELGHAALGLDHVNWVDPSNVHTPFTATRGATGITWGVDQVPGSRDDVVSPLPGAQVVHWYRLSDNNPIVIDNTVINNSTYSRNLFSFPNGDRWSASANSRVAELLGSESTQSVMISTMPVRSSYIYLTADDVNTVSFAMTGILPEPEQPQDDYSYQLVLQNGCDSAQVEIDYTLFIPPSLQGGRSFFRLANLPGGTNNHRRVVPEIGNTRILISINAAPTDAEPEPDFVLPLVFLLFVDGFENGGTARWDETLP